MALVLPPSASSTRSAFSTECSVMSCEGRIGCSMKRMASVARLLGRPQPVGVDRRDGGVRRAA